MGPQSSSLLVELILIWKPFGARTSRAVAPGRDVVGLDAISGDALSSASQSERGLSCPTTGPPFLPTSPTEQEEE